MDENCPFCKIIKGDIPSQKVYEDDTIFAVLDINPARPGHVLVLPKEHQFILPLLSPQQYNDLLLAAKKIIPSLHKSMIVNRVSLFAANGPAAGQQSPHAFIHLIPREEGDGLDHLDLSQGTVDQSAQEAIKQNTQIILQRLPPLNQEQRPNNIVQQEAPTENLQQQEHIPQAQSQDQLNNIFAMLKQNPELHELFIKDPQAVVEGVKNNPVLAKAFEGIDLGAFAKLLQEQASKEKPEEIVQKEVIQEPTQKTTQESQEEITPTVQEENESQIQQKYATTQEPSSVQDVPQAIMMSDEELIHFLDEKKQLKELIINDPDGLSEIIPKNPRLAEFFLGTNPKQVQDRLKDFEDDKKESYKEEQEDGDDSVDFDTLARHLQ